MAMEKQLKCEVDMWAFDKIKIFALASFYKWKKKNKKHFVIAVKKSLLDQVTEKMLYKTRDTYIYTYIYIYYLWCYLLDQYSAQTLLSQKKKFLDAFSLN